MCGTAYPMLSQVIPLFNALLDHFKDQKDRYTTPDDILDADFAVSLRQSHLVLLTWFY